MRWCFEPPDPPVAVPALDGVLDYRIGGPLLSGFLGSEPTAFDREVMSNHQVACEGADAAGQLGFTASETCQYDCTPILQTQKQSCPYPCENEPRRVPGIGPSSAVMGSGGPCALQLDASVACWGADGNGSPVAPHTVALPDKAIAIGGGEGSCALLANGQLACWALSGGPIDPSACPSTGPAGGSRTLPPG